VPELHRRASVWYREAEAIHEAIDHATAACDHLDAIELITTHRYEFLQRGRQSGFQWPEPGWTPAGAQDYADACGWRACDRAIQALAGAGHSREVEALAACWTLDDVLVAGRRLAVHRTARPESGSLTQTTAVGTNSHGSGTLAPKARLLQRRIDEHSRRRHYGGSVGYKHQPVRRRAPDVAAALRLAGDDEPGGIADAGHH
jgi:hypothetical protein